VRTYRGRFPPVRPAPTDRFVVVTLLPADYGADGQCDDY